MTTLNFDIQTDVKKINEALNPLMTKQIPYALALALNRTVYSAQDNVKVEMKRAFGPIVPYTLNSTYAQRASKSKLFAALRFKDAKDKSVPAVKYLEHQIEGTPRGHKSHEIGIEKFAKSGTMYETVGASFLSGGANKLDRFGNIPRKVFKDILAGLGKKSQDHVDDFRAASLARAQRKASKLGLEIPQKLTKKGRKLKRTGYFVVPVGATSHLPAGVYRRKGQTLSQILSSQSDKPQYKSIFKFYHVTYGKAERLFSKHFAYAMTQALQNKLSESTLIE